MLEIVKRRDDQVGFAVLSRRRVVERTLARLGRHRRLSKDDEALPQTSEGFIYVAMCNLVVRQWARKSPLRAPG